MPYRQSFILNIREFQVMRKEILDLFNVGKHGIDLNLLNLRTVHSTLDLVRLKSKTF